MALRRCERDRCVHPALAKSACLFCRGALRGLPRLPALVLRRVGARRGEGVRQRRTHAILLGGAAPRPLPRLLLARLCRSLVLTHTDHRASLPPSRRSLTPTGTTPRAPLPAVPPPLARHPQDQPSSYKTKACRSFARTGRCPYGPRCRFMHGDASEAEQLAALRLADDGRSAGAPSQQDVTAAAGVGAPSAADMASYAKILSNGAHGSGGAGAAGAAFPPLPGAPAAAPSAASLIASTPLTETEAQLLLAHRRHSRDGSETHYESDGGTALSESSATTAHSAYAPPHHGGAARGGGGGLPMAPPQTIPVSLAAMPLPGAILPSAAATGRFRGRVGGAQRRRMRGCRRAPRSRRPDTFVADGGDEAATAAAAAAASRRRGHGEVARREPAGAPRAPPAAGAAAAAAAASAARCPAPARTAAAPRRTQGRPPPVPCVAARRRRRRVPCRVVHTAVGRRRPPWPPVAAAAAAGRAAAPTELDDALAAVAVDDAVAVAVARPVVPPIAAAVQPPVQPALPRREREWCHRDVAATAADASTGAPPVL